MELKIMNLRDLKPYPKNAKKHPQEQIKNVAESIKEFGWQQPIVVDEQNVIIIGHCRYQAAKLLKLETVPVHVAEGLDENQVNKLRLLDNKTNESEWDLDLLLEQIPTLEFDNYEIDWGIPEEENEVEEDDFDVDSAFDEIEEPISKPGDIYQLGEHRLMFGDSTNRDDVDKLMDGKVADLVFTDPPYNVAYEGGSKKREMIKNDKIDNFYEFLYDVYQNCYNNMNAGATIYVCHSELERINFTKAFLDVGFKMSSIIIWAKNNSTFSMNKDYKQKHEPIIYGWKEGKHNWVGGNCEDTLWEIKRPTKSDLHPTMKPIELCARAITNSSNKNNIVYEPFGGSGSTLIASEQTERICYCMEIDAKYCDVIIKRWETFTGNKAEKIN